MTTDIETGMYTGSSDSFVIALLTGLSHQNVIQHIKQLAYDLEMPASEIKGMKRAHINDDDVPVVFYRLPAGFRRRLLMELPFRNVRTYTETVSEFAELSEDDLEDIISESILSIINDPIAYEWQDGVRVGKTATGLDEFGDQVFEWRRA